MLTRSILLLGRAVGGDLHRYDTTEVADGGAPIALRTTTDLWAPNGWWGEAIWPTVTVVVSSNLGATFQLTPIVDGIPLDGSGGQPDCRVTFDFTTPAAGERTTRRLVVGLSRPIRVLGTPYGRMGLRGTWIQLQLASVGAFTLPAGETNPDLRLDGNELEVVPLLRSQQVVNADG